MSRILLVSCSKAKDDHPIPMPAIDRYNGPAFRVIRKAMQEGYWPDDVTLLIALQGAQHVVSAEFGLLTADGPIPWYDRKMTPARATELKDEIAGALDGVLTGADEVFLNVAGPYYIHRPSRLDGTGRPAPRRPCAGSIWPHRRAAGTDEAVDMRR